MSDNANTVDKGSLAHYHGLLHIATKGMLGPVMYRGQENAEWKVESSAQRRIGKYEFIFESLIDYHRGL